METVCLKLGVGCQAGALLGILFDIDAQGARFCAGAVVDVDHVEAVRSGDALGRGANLVEVQGHGQSMWTRCTEIVGGICGQIKSGLLAHSSLRGLRLVTERAWINSSARLEYRVSDLLSNAGTWWEDRNAATAMVSRRKPLSNQ